MPNSSPSNRPEKPSLSWPQTSSSVQPPAKPAPSSAQNAAPSAPKSGFAAREWGASAAGFVVGVLAVLTYQYLAAAGAPSSDVKNSTEKTASTGGRTTGSAASIPASPVATAGYSGDSFTLATTQKAGSTVTLSSVSVSAPTWAVVYDNNNGTPGGALGAGLFKPGQAAGDIPLLRATESGKKYFVGLQTDDGNGSFELHGDAQVIDTNGRSVLAPFVVN